MPFQLPQLKYSYSDLEPIIDTMTVEIHYSRHHQNYLNNFKKALDGHQELYEKTIEDILTNLHLIPDDIKQQVINQGGGFYNHNLYWEVMTPQKDKNPEGELMTSITRDFGSLENLKQQFGVAATSVFGSGWTWLVKDKEKRLSIINTSNQDTPLSRGFFPLITIDVWEHAYYLRYQNRRVDYIQAWWSLIDWAVVGDKYNK